MQATNALLSMLCLCDITKCLHSNACAPLHCLLPGSTRAYSPAQRQQQQQMGLQWQWQSWWHPSWPGQRQLRHHPSQLSNGRAGRPTRFLSGCLHTADPRGEAHLQLRWTCLKGAAACAAACAAVCCLLPAMRCALPALLSVMRCPLSLCAGPQAVASLKVENLPVESYLTRFRWAGGGGQWELLVQ